MSFLPEALKCLELGLRPLPVVSRTKKPTIEHWDGVGATMPTADDIRRQFSNGAAISLQGGVISGNVECIDFDEPELYEPWLEICQAYGLGPTLDKCYHQQTPSGGYHVVYRCESPVPGNLKLAWKMGELKKEIMIETRGEGGYFLIAPSQGYKCLKGRLHKLPVIGASQRKLMIEAALGFDRVPRRVYVTQGTGVKQPGSDFDERADWPELMTRHLWSLGYERAGESYWARPGKDPRDGISATIGYMGTDLLKVFTSNAAPLEEGATYTKFAFLAFYEYGGDFIACARALAKMGYGDPLKGGTPALPKDKGTPYRQKQVVADAPDRVAQKWTRVTMVKEQEVEWLWEPYIPIGEVSMIVGDPGEGKSTVAQAIVTGVSLGSSLYGSEFRAGQAVFLSAEQSVASVTVPRFNRMGADGAKIILPDEVSEEDEPIPFVLDKSGMLELRTLCLTERPVIVVIDTVTAYIEASRDFNSANQTREWMRGLAEIARVTPCAVVLLGHLNKNQNAHPLQRVLGSVDFVGASRSVLLVGHEDSEFGLKRGLVQIKSNVGPFGDPLGFSLDEGEFKWDDGSGLDADRMLQPPAIKVVQKTADKCEEWMRGLFRDTDIVAAPSRDEHGKTAGFTSYMIDNAKKRLGVVSDTDVFGDGTQRVWKIDRTEQWWNK